MSSKNKAVAKKDNVTRNLVIGMVALVVAVGAVFTVVSNKSSESAALPSSVSQEDGYGIVFNAELTDKPVIDIWEDFQCPICQRFEALNGKYIESLIESKSAKVVYHPLSFLGPESVTMANAAACAADESKFLGMHRAIYANLAAENSGTFNASYLNILGASVGLTSNKFQTCVNSGSYGGWVNNVAADGAKKNINSTPTVFINGKELNRGDGKTDLGQYFDAAAFKAAVEKG